MAPASRRVLVINDDTRLAHSVRALLDDAGYDTRVACDGHDGLAVLSRWPADLVLLDLIMPRLDGWRFLAELETRPSARRPIVLVWSVAGNDELERARALGATDCLPRGSTGPQGLLDAIERLLNGPTTSQASKERGWREGSAVEAHARHS